MPRVDGLSTDPQETGRHSARVEEEVFLKMWEIQILNLNFKHMDHSNILPLVPYNSTPTTRGN